MVSEITAYNIDERAQEVDYKSILRDSKRFELTSKRYSNVPHKSVTLSTLHHLNIFFLKHLNKMLMNTKAKTKR